MPLEKEALRAAAARMLLAVAAICADNGFLYCPKLDLSKLKIVSVHSEKYICLIFKCLGSSLSAAPLGCWLERRRFVPIADSARRLLHHDCAENHLSRVPATRHTASV